MSLRFVDAYRDFVGKRLRQAPRPALNKA